MYFSPSHSRAVPHAGARTSAARVVAGVSAAVVVAVLVNGVLAGLARIAGASSQFPPLQATSFIPLTVAGVLVGAAGWAAVRHFSRSPRRVLGWLVPTVVLVSWLPDLALLAGNPAGTPIMAQASGIGVAALMVMHLTTAVVAVAAFSRALPVRPSGTGVAAHARFDTPW